MTLPALWTDRPDWQVRLSALAATGHIDRTEAERVAHFADHGWLIMRQAIEPDQVDAFVADLRNLHLHPGYYASTDFVGRCPQKLNGNRPATPVSIYDLYVNLQTSRRVSMHPCITRFLGLVFQAKVLAFQQVLFQVTNRQQWHRDPAHVVVDTPTFLAATWIALQHIQEGSVELAYYDRSHPMSLPQGTPRLSCVTHYCPATSMPHWFSASDKRASSRTGMWGASTVRSTSCPISARWRGRYDVWNSITEILAGRLTGL